MDDQADRMLSRIYDIRVATATATTTTAPDTTHTSTTDLLQSQPHTVPPTPTTTLTNHSPTIQPPLDASMYDDLPDIIYSSDDEPSPPWTPIAHASLTDDQKNSSYRTTNTQTTGTTSRAPYDIRVAIHHEDSADSASIDSQTRSIPRTRSIITPQTTKSHNLPRLNERTPQTINYSVGFPLPSHGPTTATFYLPHSENDTGTLYHPTYTASSQTAITCWTPLTKSTIPSLFTVQDPSSTEETDT